jgi:hypothetical protein
MDNKLGKEGVTEHLANFNFKTSRLCMILQHPVLSLTATLESRH